MDNPLSLNRDTYVYNNSLRYIDPSGHITVEEGWDSFQKGIGGLFDGNNWKRSWEVVETDLPKGLELYAQEQIGVENYQTLTDGQLTFDDAIAVAAASGELVVGRVKILNNAGKVSDGARVINKACNCFTAGTKVLTDEGEKPIEEIEVGDKVLAKDEFNPDGELAYKEVTALYRNQRD
ncbi:Hint domain-containing protein [Brevibacillus sp. TJ4]|uniref:Hint domain-containing protein n=1 Tax=Brevibacillus sp. TJ4 TaxID=3234853 RepID=UPI003B9DDFC5